MKITQRFLLKFYSFIAHCNLYSSTALQECLNNRDAPSKELTVYILAVKLLITCTKYASYMIKECEPDLGQKLGQACSMQVTPAACRPRPDITCPLGIILLLNKIKVS